MNSISKTTNLSDNSTILISASSTSSGKTSAGALDDDGKIYGIYSIEQFARYVAMGKKPVVHFISAFSHGQTKEDISIGD